MRQNSIAGEDLPENLSLKKFIIKIIKEIMVVKNFKIDDVRTKQMVCYMFDSIFIILGVKM